MANDGPTRATQQAKVKQAIKQAMSGVDAGAADYYQYVLDFNKCVSKAKQPDALNIFRMAQLSHDIFQGALNYVQAMTVFLTQVGSPFLRHPISRKRIDSQMQDVREVSAELLCKWKTLAQYLDHDPDKLSYAARFTEDADQASVLNVFQCHPVFAQPLVNGKQQLDVLNRKIEDLNKTYAFRTRTL